MDGDNLCAESRDDYLSITVARQTKTKLENTYSYTDYATLTSTSYIMSLSPSTDPLNCWYTEGTQKIPCDDYATLTSTSYIMSLSPSTDPLNC